MLNVSRKALLAIMVAVSGHATAATTPDQIFDDIIKNHPFQDVKPGAPIPGSNGIPMPDLQKERELLQADLDRAEHGITGCEYKLFISSSLTDQQIWSWRQLAQNSNVNIDIVIRGLVSEKIPETTIWMAERLDAKTARPGLSANIDPESFKEYGVERVPAIGYRCGKEVLVTYGSAASPELAKQKFDEGKRGIYETGTTKPVVERDLIEELKDRASKLDLDKKTREKVLTYWDRQKATLPHNTKSEKRIHRYEYRLTDDMPLGSITLASGQVLPPLKAGDVLPEELVKDYRCMFHRDVVAIDGTDPAQVRFGLEMVKRARASGRPPLVLTTNFKSWDSNAQLTQYYGVENVYKIEQKSIDTFDLRGVPTHVTMDKDCNFVSREYTDSEVKKILEKIGGDK